MARVTVEAVGFLRRLFSESAGAGGGAGEALVLSVPDGTTVEGLVRLLAHRNPGFAAIAYERDRLTDAFQVVVGDRMLELAGGWERVLADDDRVLLLPPFEGG